MEREALFSDGRCGGMCFAKQKGGGLEEGGLEIHPDGRRADSFCMSFPVLFQGRFPGGHFYGFCAVFVHLRVPLGGSFSVFFGKV